MNSISVKKRGITGMGTDVIVNAANRNLAAGGGVCGAIFRDAGYKKLQKACDKIGHCDTGSAVITRGYNLKAKYVIHAVGPRWSGGDNNEPEQLYSAYYSSLELALKNKCHSIAFPLISSGIFGYPKEKAWYQAIVACKDFLDNCKDGDIQVIFCVISDNALSLGQKTLSEIAPEYMV